MKKSMERFMKKCMKMAFAVVLAAILAVILVPQAAQAKTIYNLTGLKSYELDETTGKYKLAWENVSTFDSKGRETKNQYIYYLDDGSTQVTTMKTAYNKYGNRSTRTETDSSGNYAKITYKYNSNKLLTTIVTTNKKKKTLNTVTMTYDKKGNLVKEVSKGENNYTETYAYDSKGNMIREKYKDVVDPDNSYTQTWTYKSGKLTSSVISYADGSTRTETYKSGVIYKEVYKGDSFKSVDYYYTSGDAKGLIRKSVSKSFIYDKTYTDRTTYTYTFDSKGNKKSETYQFTSDSFTYSSSSRYAYDKAGNCTIVKYYDEDGTCTNKTYYTWLKQKV